VIEMAVMISNIIDMSDFIFILLFIFFVLTVSL